MSKNTPIIINPGDELGTEMGFTKDKFSGYIAKEGDYIWISAINENAPRNIWKNTGG